MSEQLNQWSELDEQAWIQGAYEEDNGDSDSIDENIRQTPRYLVGDCLEKLKQLASNSAQCCVSSPPYFLQRNYGVDGQIGQEKHANDYVKALVEVFREVRRILKDDGTLFLNLGDTYKSKSAMGLPWKVALALIEDGWLLRNEIIWEKASPMPESVKDRWTNSHEKVFFFSKSKTYYFNWQANLEPYATDVLKQQDTSPLRSKAVGRIGEVKSPSAHAAATGRTKNSFFKNGGRNKRDVWTIPTERSKELHFAAFPQKLVKQCLLPATKSGDLVLDPFSGSGTTGIVSFKMGREFVGFDLNPQYIEISQNRFRKECLNPNPLIWGNAGKLPQLIYDFNGWDRHEPWLKSDLEIAKAPSEKEEEYEQGELIPLPCSEGRSEFMDVKEVAALLGVSTKSIYRWFEQGIIPGHRFGKRKITFKRTEIAEWVSARSKKDK